MARLVGDFERMASAQRRANSEPAANLSSRARISSTVSASKLSAIIARRIPLAVEDKIAQAEAQAVAEVRSRSAEIAVEAARVLLTQQMAEKGDTLVAQAIKDVGDRLN